MREASQRAYNRLRAVVGDPRHRGMVFQNEHFAETWVPRLDTETPTQRNQRAIRKAVEWVQDFIQREWERTTVLQQQNKAIQEMEAGNKDDGEVEVEEEEGKGERKKKRRGRRGKKKLTADQTLTVMPQVIVLTQSKDLVLVEEKGTTVVGGSLISQNKATESNVKCMTCQEYVDSFFADDVQLKELCDSLTQLLLLGEDRSSDKDLAGKGYEEYRADDVLEAELKSGAIWRGTLRVSTHNNAEAYVRTNDHSGLSSDILIQGKANMNRAIHGDLVAVELFPRERWAAPSVTLRRQGSGQGQDQEEAGVEQGDDATTTGRSRKVFPTGKVVGIFQRNWRPYVVTLQLEHGENSSASEKLDKEDSATSQSSATQAVLCIPMDYKIPKIRIRTRNTEFLKDQRFIVAIDSWEKDSFYPNGHYVLSLGPIGDLETETAALLTENSVSAPPFPAAILNSLPSLTGPDAWAVTEEDVASRRDIRESHRVYSIDPLGCQDIDDALSVRFLNDGKIEIGVHIADVTHFVPHNSLLDIEARARGTSVYLADRRLDMLPSLCSLRGGQDRFAVSVLWTFASDFQTVERTWFGRTIIRSCHEFHYELCQSILDEALSESEREKLPDYDLLRKELLVLLEVSSKMQRKRTRQGALILASTEAKFELSETRSPTSIHILFRHFSILCSSFLSKELPVHDLVAEFMILANQYVAEQIYSAYPDAALLRRHPFPRNSKKFQELIEAAEARGFHIDTTSNKTLARSLDAAVVPEDPSVNRLLRQLATKAMEEAQYVSTGSYDIHDLYHHGLALNMYTHFTSPIRRYADVIVHRQLLGSLIRPTKAPAYFNDEKLEEIAQHINKKHRNAKHASKDSSELFKTMYFKQTPDNLVDGIIYQMKANGFVVAIPRYGLKGAVYLRDKDGQLIVPSNALSLSPTAYTSDLRIVDYRFEPTQQSILLKVTSAKEPQQQLVGVHLFDHVTLHVVVDESRAHRPSVKLELVHFGMDPKLKEEAAKQYAAGGGTRVNTTKAVLEHQKELAAAAAAATGSFSLLFRHFTSHFPFSPFTFSSNL
ncbi:DIS3 mitotic control [Balamuthia mandrillaris]